MCQKLVELVPGDYPKKAVLVNSGAEAVEDAVKIARVYTRRPAIIAFSHSFHGRTLLTLSLTGRDHPYKDHFRPLVPEVYRLPYPYLYRGGPFATAEGCLAALREALATHVAPEEVAAVIVEPVLGEGGFVVPPREFLTDLEAVCRQYGILLIVDEIQSGFMRTGRMFAFEHFGITPDLVTVAKSLAGGMPLSAREKLMLP
ncbi:MAG: 4-aminobutyrate aminotransferase / (S)-3-amino-2-methylpropionate transaminase / 5-aminovalerate [Clostridia bacterium]|nr:4-aminobutyrate aminotransferase / (S)-3-amino-2-methylpropionate transaminase / 5-aminovalerate [Clostridia bacterium]